MPRQQRFEGDALETVLERVRNEAGPGAKVLEAKKVRDGGVAGFFSKEKFVLTVELPDAPRKLSKKAIAAAAKAREAVDVADTAEAIAPPSSILEMVDVVDEAEQQLTVPIAAAQVIRPWYEDPPIVEPAPMAPPVDFEALDPPVVQSSPPRVVHEPVERPTMPMPSTEGDSFRDVLRRLANDVADLDEVDIDIVNDIDQPAAEPITVDLTDDTEEIDEPTGEVEVDVLETLITEEPIEDDEIDMVDTSSELVPVSSALTTHARRSPSVYERSVGLELLELGVPAAFVPELGGILDRDEIHAALMRALQLPSPPALPRRANAVIAVVGERRAAVKLATMLGDEAVLREASVQLADRDGSTTSIRRARPSKAAAGKSTRQRARRRIVAVPASPGSSSEWTRELLDSLEPDMVWGVAPADRKSEDIAAWAVDIGGFDVLAVTGVEKTVSPASVLRLGIPVGLLDWKLATAEAWADLLTDRLAA